MPSKWGWVIVPSLLAAACAGDDSASADTEGASTGSSSGSQTTAPTGAADTTVGDPDDTSAGDIADETSGDTADSTTTTTGSQPIVGRASIILRDDLDTPGVDELFRVDYVDGAVTEPIKISGPPGDGVALAQLSDSESLLFYRPLDPTVATIEWALIPLTDGEAGPATPMQKPPAPESGIFSQPALSVDESQVLYNARLDTMGTDAALYLADISGGEAQAPAVVADTPPAGETFGNGSNLSPDGSWVSYLRNVTGGGETNGWIAPASPPNPAAAVMVSDLDTPGQALTGAPTFVPGGDALWYRADRDIDQVRELFFVDISGATPAAPVKINEPLIAGEQLQPTRVSPDGLRLAYFVTDDLLGEVHTVAFDGASVSMPVRVSTLGDTQATAANIEWSPDGSWLLYSAQHETADAVDLYAVDMSGASPATPALLTTGGVVPGGEVLEAVFDSTSSWVYFVATLDDVMPEMYRVDLSGRTPSAAQKVSAELRGPGALDGSIILSHDEQWLLYHAIQGSPAVRELFMVDISGARPSPAVRVNGPLGPGEDVSFGTWWSGDDSAIVYATQTAPDSDRPLLVVERESVGEAVPVAESPTSVIVLDSTPE